MRRRTNTKLSPERLHEVKSMIAIAEGIKAKGISETDAASIKNTLDTMPRKELDRINLDLAIARSHSDSSTLAGAQQ